MITEFNLFENNTEFDSDVYIKSIDIYMNMGEKISDNRYWFNQETDKNLVLNFHLGDYNVKTKYYKDEQKIILASRLHSGRLTNRTIIRDLSNWEEDVYKFFKPLVVKVKSKEFNL